MCRNIKMLFNFDPPVTEEEIRAASLQFVRKVSGFNKPSKANEAAFGLAVDEIAAAFRKVSNEIVTQSIALSEEFTLTTAELSYLQDRKVAYENLAKRTGLEGVKSVCLALQQSERYGTPLGQSLRVMAQENRDMRMNEAEKKAAALPPKLPR